MNTADAAVPPELIALDAVRKSYNLGRPSEAEVLHGIDLQVRRGEFIALMGPSGSGKSTLLNILGLLERMTSGSFRLDGEEVQGLDDAALTLRRRSTLRFVFLFRHLLPAFSALENVELPLLLTGLSARERRAQAEAALHMVSLSDRMDHYPNELSGGQQQRVAIARALACDPPLIVADEPTGDLDRHTGQEVLGMLQQLQQDLGKTIVMVTHDPKAAACAGRLIHLEKGVLVPDSEMPAGAR